MKKRTPLISLILTVLAFALSGCVGPSLSKEECMLSDWYQIGYTDGVRGYSQARLQDHREACTKHGVNPVVSEYQKGHEDGVVVFCTPQNGLSAGASGWKYSGICPRELESGFMVGYNLGAQLHRAKSWVNGLNAEIEDRELDLDYEETQLDENRTKLLSDEPLGEHETRESVYLRVKDIEEKIEELELEIDGLEDELTGAWRHYNEIQAKVSKFQGQ